MEDINKLVTDEFTKIFNCLNKKYFNNELSTPLFTLSNKFSISNGSVNENTVIIAGQDGVFNMTINMCILDKPISEIAAIICHNMIRYYDLVNNEKIENMTSNNGIYHNKNFKIFANKCDLKCRHSKYGWNITYPTDKFIQFCTDNNFAKTWKGIYSKNNGKRKSSTQTWACECGRHKSVRVTKDPDLICSVCMKKLYRVS